MIHITSMRFKFIWIGKTKHPGLLALQNEMFGRLSHFIKCEIIELKESKDGDGVKMESNRIAAALNQSPFVCLLDISGKQLASDGVAREIEKWQMRGVKEIAFVIGGADGVADSIREIADFRLSLSFMTFTHDMARVILLEQLYRAFTIINGFPYQR